MLKKLLVCGCFLLGALVFLKCTAVFAGLATDFTQDYAAALALRQGVSIYGDAAVRLLEQAYGVHGIVNVHPPLAAVLFLPFTSLSLFSAFHAWNVLNLVIYFAICIFVVRSTAVSKEQPIADLPLVLAAGLLWFPFIANIANGQITLLIVGLVFAAWYLTCARREYAAGIALALATALKLFPAFLLLYFVLNRRWRVVSSFVFTSLALLGLSLVVLGSADNIHFFTKITLENTARWIEFLPNQSLTGVFGVIIPTYAKTLALVPALILCALHLRLPWHDGENVYLFSLVLLTALLITPVAWSHSYVFLLLPFFAKFREVYHASMPRNQKWFQARYYLLAFVLLSLPDVFIARAIHASFAGAVIPPWAALLAKPGFFGMCLLWGLLYTEVKSQQAGAE